jgi:hypothetical protein
MKKSNYKIALLASLVSVIFATSCNKQIDNREYPNSRISGQFLYNGQPVQIMGTSSDVVGTNMLQLIQTGPGQWIPGYIKMFAREDGSYTIQTFDGDYALIITPGKGPWVPFTDSLKFSLKGEAKNVNFNVTPYFWLTDYANSFQDSVFTASFNLEKIVPTAELDKVVIYLGTTSIVDNISKLIERSFTNLSPGPNTISIDLKTLSAKEKSDLKKTGYVYARVGVKTKNVSDLLYSRVTQFGGK